MATSTHRGTTQPRSCSTRGKPLAKAFRPLANAAMLLHTGKLAVRLAIENVALFPEIAPRADLLDLVKRSIDVTE